MSDASELERRYRRLLATYPATFRAEHEDEMITVLMSSAAAGQTRPTPGEYVNLASHAMASRVITPTAWELRHHPHAWIRARTLIGLALIICTVVLAIVGYGWGVWLLIPAAIHLLLARRLAHFTNHQPPPRSPHITPR